MTFQFHRGRPQLQSGGAEAWSNERDLPEANPTDTVPVRLVGSQREMKCINGESVLLQVQVRFQSKAKQNRSSSAHFHSESRQGAGRAGGYSRCSYILRLFPQKHPLHESDILFTEEKDRRAFRFPSLARPDRLALLLLLRLSVSSSTARALWKSLVTRVVLYKTTAAERALWLLKKINANQNK